jgi:hypothetical protein
MQSVNITTKIKSLNPAHGEVYSILHHEMKLGSDLQLFDGLSGFLHQQNWQFYSWNHISVNRIGGVIVSVIGSGAVDGRSKSTTYKMNILLLFY